MGLLCDYFAAPSDEEAAVTLGWVEGPAKPPPEAVQLGYPVVSAPGVEPVVMMGRVEALLTNRSLMSEILHDPARQAVAFEDEGGRMVIPLGPRMDEALASASDERLAEIAVPWSEAEEFGGSVTLRYWLKS